MFFEILFCTLAGVLFGTITGMTPGIHVNLISIMIVSISGYLLDVFHPLSAAIIIISMGITHTFIDSIPSIFLGVPDDTALSVLPGHALLLEGRGKEAVRITLIGSVVSLVLMVILSPFLCFILKNSFETINSMMLILLISVSIFSIVKKDMKTTLLCGFVFLMSGTIGHIILNTHGLEQPLLPLFSGMFGISSLLLSLNSKNHLPEQSDSFPDLSKKDIILSSLTSIFCGSATGTLPGLGSSQAAAIGTRFSKNMSREKFLLICGGINTVNFGFSIFTLFMFEKARNGAVIAVKELIGSINQTSLLILILCTLIAASISVLVSEEICLIFAKLMEKVNYDKLSLFIIFLVVLVVFLISKKEGFFILVISTAMGLCAPLLKVPRNCLMGSILIPVMLFRI